MTLSEISLAADGKLSSACDGNMEINVICTDSRKIEPGCLFIAIKGERFNGHDFVSSAIEKGAAAVVVHEDVDCDRTITVKNTRKALCDIARFYRKKFDIKLVGITGSVGKTTTKEMIYTVLSAEFNTHKTSGNFNNDIGLPMTIFGLNRSHEAAVIEMGMSAFGEIELLTGIALPDIGVITNIGVSHIENLGSRENIMKAKLEILSGMKKDAPLLLNGDDDLLGSINLERKNIYYYGIKSEKCRFKAENIIAVDSGTEFDILFDGKRVHVVIPVVGIHNVMNATAAFGVGIILGIDPECAAEALANYKTCGMRQKLVNKNGITVIEDCYNASPDSMRASLTTLSDIKASKRIAVLGDMLELGKRSEEFHRQIGEFACGKADILYCYGKNAKWYVEGYKAAGGKIFKYFEDKKTLAEKLYSVAEEGDSILFKGSRGMKLEEIINSLYILMEKK